TRGRDLGGLLDAMIIAAGLGLLSWTFLMRPITADESLGLTGQLVSLAYPLADVVLLAMLARLLTSPGARTASFRLLTVAVLAQEGLTDPTEVDWRGVTTGALVLYLLILARVWTLVRQVQDQSVQLAALANTDALTGIANRRTWDLAVPLALAAATRSGAP